MIGKRLRGLIGAALVLLAAGCGRSDDGRVVIGLTDDPTGKARSVNEQLVRQFEAENPGIEVRFISVPVSATERLGMYLQFLGARSPRVDVYQIDVIWPGTLAEHFIDLGEALGGARDDFFPRIIENNTVDGRLVAIPWFTDAGILYYRTDLLAKYGFDAPPQTWDELEAMARTIQEGERAAGRRDFWGYVWQGAAYEGLTCNVMEWIVSHGGGLVVEDDGRISIDNAQARAAIERAEGWVGTISPPGVANYMEEDGRNLFHTGNVAFMRNWPYAYSLMDVEGSAVQGRFDIAVLPSGGERHAATLGGWQLAVSRYSRHPEEATKLALFLSSAEAQKARALGTSHLPTRPALYDDPEIAAELPFIPKMKEVFHSATARPSTPAGGKYNEVSTTIFQNVHRVLIGRQEAGEAMKEIEAELKKVLER